MMDETVVAVDVPRNETPNPKSVNRQLVVAVLWWTIMVGVACYSVGASKHAQPYAAISEDQFVIAKGDTNPERIVLASVMDPGDTPMTCLPTDKLVKIYDTVQLGAFYSGAAKEMMEPIRDRISKQTIPYSNKM